MLIISTYKSPCKYIYTIEFKKRGLPHAHLLLFMHVTLKHPTNAHIDRVISDEIPDYRENPDGYNAMKNYTIHGQCGEQTVERLLV